MKIKLYVISSIVVFSMITIALLLKHGIEIQKLRSPFNRQFSAQAQINTYRDLESTAFCIAGITNGQIYLAGNAPLRIKSFNARSLQEASNRNIKIKPGFQIHHSRIIVDSLNVYVIDPQTNQILRGDYVASLEPITSKSHLIIEMVPVNQNLQIIRTLKENAREFTLAKLSSNPPFLERAPHLLQNQADGMFSVDGKLHYVAKLNSLLYIYLYRNEFMVFDTTMHLTYRNHTIDSFAHASLQVKTNTLKQTIVLAKPPPVVNPKSCVSGTTLFVNSSVIGNDEDDDEFYHSSVIDTYDIVTGKYVYSFYIPLFQGLSIKDFAVYKGTIYVIYGHYLVCYEVPVG